MTLIERWHDKSPDALLHGQPQSACEYDAAIAGVRYQHLLSLKAEDYVKARWRNDGTSGGHYRTLEKMVREYLKAA